MEVGAGFLVDGDDVCTCRCEVVDIAFGVFDHEVDVTDEGVGFVEGGEGFKSNCAEGDVGDEVAVHDVYVEPVDAVFEDGLALCAEVSEVGGEDGWS